MILLRFPTPEPLIVHGRLNAREAFRRGYTSISTPYAVTWWRGLAHISLEPDGVVKLVDADGNVRRVSDDEIVP